MAKKTKKRTTRSPKWSARDITIIESKWGVSHRVPRRGTAEHRKMLSSYARRNPASNAFRVGDPAFLSTDPNLGKAMASIARSNPRGRARRNPYTTKLGYTVSPENCPVPLSASLLAARRDALAWKSYSKAKRRALIKKDPDRYGRSIKDKPVPSRFGNCDARTAPISLRLKPADAGSKFSGVIKEGFDPKAKRKDRAKWVTRTKDKTSGTLVELSYWPTRRGKNIPMEMPTQGSTASPAAPTGPASGGLSEFARRMLPWWPKA